MVLPWPSEADYQRRCKRRKEIAAKLKAKGIDPRGLKFGRLIERMMRKP